MAGLGDQNSRLRVGLTFPNKQGEVCYYVGEAVFALRITPPPGAVVLGVFKIILPIPSPNQLSDCRQNLLLMLSYGGYSTEREDNAERTYLCGCGLLPETPFQSLPLATYYTNAIVLFALGRTRRVLHL